MGNCKTVCILLIQLAFFTKQAFLVLRSRDPFGQHPESRPLAAPNFKTCVGKMAWTSLMILILFCASFMPFYVKIQLLNFCKCLQTMPYKKFDFISHVFLYLSSLMDPFMYAWRVPKFRRSLRECLRFRKRTAVRPIVIKMNSQKQNNDFIPAVSLDTGYSPVVRRQDLLSVSSALKWQGGFQ